MRVKWRRNKALELPDGDFITNCDCCPSTPLRASWLRECPECKLDVCAVCMPNSATVCTGCATARANAPQSEAIPDALTEALTEVATAPAVAQPIEDNAWLQLAGMG